MADGASVASEDTWDLQSTGASTIGFSEQDDDEVRSSAPPRSRGRARARISAEFQIQPRPKLMPAHGPNKGVA